MNMSLPDVIKQISDFSYDMDDLGLLQRQHWVMIDDIEKSRLVYIFRDNQELLISQDGLVQKARWEHLGNNAILIERKGDIYLMKRSFFDPTVLALKTDGRDEYSFLVNESCYNDELNSLDKIIAFLLKRYLRNIPVKPTSEMYRYHIGTSPLYAQTMKTKDKKATSL